MRTRLLAVVLFVGVMTLTLSLTRGQDKPDASPAKGTGKAPVPASVPAAPQAALPLAPAKDLSHLTGQAQQFLHTGQRGADWLFRMHEVKGRFQPGLMPALNQVVEGDGLMRQAGATAALGHAARFCGEDRYAARATQAVLGLLLETTLDPSDSLSRTLALPPGTVNRLGGVAAVVLAIHELPTPQADLFDHSDQLCRTLRKMVRPDGALGWDDGSGKLVSDDDGIPHHPGLALQALLASHRQRPADWKLDIVRKALPVYRTWWKSHQDLDFAATMAPAFAEAYVVTKDKAFADFVFVMGDWLCTTQYVEMDPRRALWFGGFRSVQGNKAVETMPTSRSALYAGALIAGCRVAGEAGDLTHHQRYSEAVERTLQFLTTLQYTDGVTQHFAPWYRPKVLGAFHASHLDGNIRLDDTRYAVKTLFGYLEHVVR
jgi:hypothetical protein